MDARSLIDIITLAERLKDTTRHCYTSRGRHESVAEHSWMTTLIALFLRDEFPEADMDKVIRMCIVHDLGECFTGDIPAFLKTEEHESREEELLNSWVSSLPEPYDRELRDLYEEMAERRTMEARIYKAIDGLEAVVQHNLSDISTWIPHEYEMNLTYADDKVEFSPYLRELRRTIREDTEKKIAEEKSREK